MMKFIDGKFFIFSILILASGQSTAESVCDLALKSGSYDTTDYASYSRIMLKKRDEACKSEYASQSEAVSSGQQSGGSVGYGAFSLGLSDAKQSASGKWSISDSKFCKASAEDLDSVSAQTLKTQVGSIALAEWRKCIESVETNKTYIQYTPNQDGTGMTALLIRKPSGGFGKITGVAVQGNLENVSCSISGQPVELNKKIEVPITSTQTAIGCMKRAESSLQISLATTEGDQQWIRLPSVAQITTNQIGQLEISTGNLRRQVETLANDVNSLRDSIGSSNVKLSGRIEDLGQVRHAKYYLIDYSVMRNFHPDCNSPSKAMEGHLACGSAIQGYCISQGFEGGVPQQTNASQIGFTCVK